MSLEIVAGLLGSQLVRAVASEVATTLACQALQHAVGTMAKSASAAPIVQPSLASLGAAPAIAAPALYALPTVEILSAVPGRVRLRVHGIRDDAARSAESAAAVRILDGVHSADANPATGTILARFDPARIDVPEIVAALEPPTRPRRLAREVGHLRLVVG
jgi:hypothetical protein